MNRKFSAVSNTANFPAAIFGFNRLYGAETEQDLLDLAHAKANYDKLTGLPNRMLFMDRLHQALLLAAREQKQLALLYLDIDRFWQVNELYGRTAGDELLQSAALRLKHCMSHGDTLARLSGDEFVMLLKNVDGLDDVMKTLDKITTSFRRNFQIGERMLTASTSIGVSIYPRDADEVSSLLQCADVALYRSKTAGGNGYSFFQAGMDDAAGSSAMREKH